MNKFAGFLSLLAAFVLLLGTAVADDAEKDKGKGKGKGGKGGFGDPEQVFKKLDANSDGKLTKDEFLKIADKVKDQAKAEKVKGFLSERFAKLSEGKESVSLEQFKKAAEERKKSFEGKKGGKGRFGNPEEVFKKLDANSDGKLTKDEFLKVADKVKDQAKAEKLKGFLSERFAKISEGKESVSLEQFKKAAEERKKNAEPRKKKKKNADTE